MVWQKYTKENSSFYTVLHCKVPFNTKIERDRSVIALCGDKDKCLGQWRHRMKNGVEGREWFTSKISLILTEWKWLRGGDTITYGDNFNDKWL